MLIGKEWKIESDSLNVTLYRKMVSKKGKEGWRAEGYFATLKNALQDMVNREIKDTTLSSLQVLETKIEALYSLINSLPLIETQ